MSIEQLPDNQTIEAQIAEIHDLFESAKIIGCTLSGVLIKENHQELDANCILCIYQTCMNGTTRHESGVPVFPAFYSLKVAERMAELQLYEVVDYSLRNGVSRYFVRFSETWL